MELWSRQIKDKKITLQSPNKKSPSSMGFHDNWRAPLQMTQVFHGIPWNIPWNSMELWCRQMKYQLVPWNSMEYSIEFHGTLVPPNDISLSSMEFHGTLVTPNEVSLSSMELWDCHSMAFYPGWTSKGYSIEFWSRQIKNHWVPWDSIELGGHHFKWHKYSMEFHGIFHGIPWNYGAAKWHIT